ncbi:hypothetical protein [Candidatus Berkiella aquae]|uniref:ATP-binding protein n=1 Tax=Candidatus Berkiella aquae TaxID=295108 RepID=A0A0Q9YJH8_9GAMM|nr:hypothetical protein [Candidatus Berkiella aquae]MCS5711287.1 ATP-binding protein [Candidatus Berkiella aquae]
MLFSNFKNDINIDELRKKREEILSQGSNPAYHQRHIAALKPVVDWDSNTISIQKQHNRLLQTNYSGLNPDVIIDIAKTTKEAWLTDFVCPTVNNALKLNLAADLVSFYKMPVEDLNAAVQMLYRKILEKDTSFIDRINETITIKLMEKIDSVCELATNQLKKVYPDIKESDLEYSSLAKKFMLLEILRARKAITHAVLKQELQLHSDLFAALGIQPKTILAKGENIDYSILGAAGSGKSSITKKLIQGDKLDFAILATDDYRGVILDDAHESIVTDQVLTRTQDTAFSIKELVQDRLTSLTQGRPNIILDCVSLEGWHRTLLENNNKTISAVACLNDATLVPSRAYNRAIDPTSSVADKGRQVNTSALLKGHAVASSQLLTSIPYGVTTDLYDTNISQDQDAPILARVITNNTVPQIEIFNLAKLASFLCKSNLNQEALKNNDLYYTSKNGYQYDSQHRAEQILKLVPACLPYKKDNYELILRSNKSGMPYAKIYLSDNGIKLEILNLKALLKVLGNQKMHDEGWILKSIIMQIHYGSMAAVKENIKKYGREKVFYLACRHILPKIRIAKPKDSKVKPLTPIYDTQIRVGKRCPGVNYNHTEKFLASLHKKRRLVC